MNKEDWEHAPYFVKQRVLRYLLSCPELTVKWVSRR